MSGVERDPPAHDRTDRPRRGPMWMLVVVGLSVLAGWGGRRLVGTAESETAAEDPGGTAASAAPVALSRSALLYHVHCAKCHGPDGRGDAESQARLRPPPRDFAERPWRFEM